MILDSSAVIAVLCQEPAFEELVRKIGSAHIILVGAPTLANTQLALSVKLGRDASPLVEQFLAEIQAVVAPFGGDHISSFFAAFSNR